MRATARIVADEDVRRLDIAVNDRGLLAMSFAQPPANLAQNVDARIDRNELVAMRFPKILQRSAGYVFEREICTRT